MKRSRLLLVIVAFGLFSVRARAQDGTECKGDFDGNGRVSIDELVTAVNSALKGCETDTRQQGCIDSGGSVTSESCCLVTPDYPDTCGIGPCGCGPLFSHDVSFCDCGASMCFDRDANACVNR